MTVSIPASVKQFVDQQIASGAYPDAEAYIKALVEADRKRKALRDVEKLVVAGLDSGATSEVTDREWSAIRREGLQRIAKRKDAAQGGNVARGKARHR